MKKSERIALYRDAYLKGKSEEECRRFDEKDVEKQYGAIMAWKRRKDEAARQYRRANATEEEATPRTIAAVLIRVKSDIHSLKSLSDEDRGMLYDALNGALDEVNNFDRYKKAELLQRLESQRDEIYRQGEDLNRQIDELRQQLC